jgi:ribosomal protein S12 methylthiotransferase
MKRVYMENLGCSKNQVDAEVMLAELQQEWIHTEDVSEADLILVNTCGFIESAREESINTFFELSSANPKAKIILAGCMAQRYAEELTEELGEASAIFGNRDLSRIGEVASRVMEGERVVLLPSYGDVRSDVYERNELLNFPGSAYLKISEGCNHRCSYCAIPLIRGGLRSRPLDLILDEAKQLVASGIKEINLIAQDLASWGTDRSTSERFMDLLSALCTLEGTFTLRLLYIHPDTFPAELPRFIAEHPRILPYFDIPFQHADTQILRSMGRVGTKQSHLAMIQSIRSEVPDAVIRSTILLGYPGESEESFAHVLDFLGQAQLDWVGSFIYSREEGTKAFDLRDDAEHARAVEQAAVFQRELEAIQTPITQSRLARFVGREVDVLIEELIEGEDLAIGRMWGQAPEVDGLTVVMTRRAEPGTVVRCGIRRVNGFDLEAIVVEGALDG